MVTVLSGIQKVPSGKKPHIGYIPIKRLVIIILDI